MFSELKSSPFFFALVFVRIDWTNYFPKTHLFRLELKTVTFCDRSLSISVYYVRAAHIQEIH